MKMLKLLIFVLSSVLLIACGKKETTEAPKTNDIKKDSVQKPESGDVSKVPDGPKKDSAAAKEPVLKWEFKTLGKGNYDEPITQVYVLVNGKKHEVQKIEFGFSEVTKESYPDHRMPKDALIACRGWWAGAGMDYWVTRKDNNTLLIYSREIGETTTEDGEPSDYEGKPKLIKSIAIE